jgi:hypothetical protein
MKVPLSRNYFLWNQNGICFLRDLGLWVLTIQPFHSYTLAYCRPIHLISIEFQNIDNDQGSPPKKLFLPLQLLWSCNCAHCGGALRERTLHSRRVPRPRVLLLLLILQSVGSLWLRFFLHTIGIIRYKILWLEVVKHHFILIIGPHVNKYMFQHVSGPIFAKTALKF